MRNEVGPDAYLNNLNAFQCEFSAHSKAGVELQGAQLGFYGCTFEGSEIGAMISTIAGGRQSLGLVFSGCYFEANARQALKLGTAAGVRGASLVGNYFNLQTPSSERYLSLTGSDIVVQGNAFYNLAGTNATTQILLDNVRNIRIGHNLGLHLNRIAQQGLVSNLSLEGDGTNTFSGVHQYTNVNNSFVGRFTGDASGLRGLDAGHIASGIVSESRIDLLIARDSEVFPTVLANDGSGSTLDADALDGLDATAFWKLSGNAETLPGTHFLGTTDPQALVLKTAGAEALRIDPLGKVGVGTTEPVDKLHVAGSAVFQGPAPWIDVRAYGATADDETDDTVALRNALAAVPDSGAVVFIPPGTYCLSATLALRSKTALRGTGAATVIKRSPSGAETMFFSEGVSHVTVEMLALDMNGAGGGQASRSFATALAFRSQSSNVRIRDVRIRDSTGTNVCCRHGILVLESDHVWIERNHLTDGLRMKAGGTVRVDLWRH